MSEVTFEEAFDRTVGHEGGYINDVRDPGGETKWGISKRSYPRLNIALLTREQARQIYYDDFWSPCGAFLTGALRYQVFDAAFNHGAGNAIRMMQRAVGVVDDGHYGPLTQAAYRAMEAHDIALRFLAERLEFMAALSTFAVFGRGWSRRIVANLRFAAKDI